MNSVFNEDILADKLSKLNSTQQCIETLSHWCIFHRSKAERVVATWEKQFHSSEMAHKVPLLYLANDILQNSKRKGNEFVTEFWKVLPSAVKDLLEKGDDRAKSVSSRLVKIWEERKVFGSEAKSLEDIMLGKELPTPLQFSRKRSRSVRIMKRDSRSIKTKLTIGGPPEKIVSAYHSVLSEHTSEEEEKDKCKSTVHRIKKMEKDVDIALTTAKDPNRKKLSKELEEEENVLKQCIQKLKVVEANRAALVSQLREALNEQESDLENVRTQIQVAQAQVEESSNMRKNLDNEDYVAQSKPSTTTATSEVSGKTGTKPQKKTAAAIAAEVADKLTASSSSQYIMSSVLSTFAAEEAKNAGLTNSSIASTSFPSTNYSLPKPERPVSDPNLLMPAQPVNPPQYQSVMMMHPTMQPPQYHSLQNPTTQQYLQPPGAIGSTYGVGYPGIPPLPPPGPSPPFLGPLVPLAQPPLHMSQQQQHQQLTMQQQQGVLLPQHPHPPPPSFRPLQPGMVYYSQPSNRSQ